MNIQIITHFYTTDPNCMSDYASREVVIGGKQVLSLSDAYHSSGESAESFVQGYLLALTQYGVLEQPPKVERVDVADDDAGE